MKKLAALVLVMALILTLSATAFAAEPIEFTYCVHTANGLHEQTLEHFIAALKEIVGEENVIVSSFTPGTMGSESELAEAVIFGDMTMSTPSDSLITKNMGIDDWTALPGIVTSREEATELMLNADGPLSVILDKEYEEFGVIRLGGLDNGFRCIASNEDMSTLAALQKLKTRVANVWTMVDLYNNAGVQATIIDSSEVITSLQQGQIDAVENSFVNLAQQGYIDLLNKVLAVNFIYGTRSFICNADWFYSLSEENQAAVKEAGRIACEWTNEEYARLYDEYMEDSRWEVIELDEEQYATFEAAAAKVMEKAYGTFDTEILDQVNAVLAAK